MYRSLGLVRPGLEVYRRRVVIPLVRRNTLDAAVAESSLNPIFTIEGVEVVLHPLEIVSVAVDRLGEKVGTLSQEGDRIVGAVDEMLTRAWD